MFVHGRENLVSDRHTDRLKYAKAEEVESARMINNTSAATHTDTLQ